MGMLRDIIIADTDEEARRCGAIPASSPAAPGSCRSASAAACSIPKTGKAPTTEEAIAKGYACVGTVDTVLRAMEAQQKRQPVNWMFGWTYNALVPHAMLMRSIEPFWTKVMPRFISCP